MKRAFLLFLLACSPQNALDQAAESAQENTSESELNLFSRDVMVYLNTQADLNVALDTKEKMGTQVYQRLVAHAQSTQAPVLKLLEGHDYRAFYITNAIFVKKASRGLIKQLKAHPSVARVLDDKKVFLALPPRSAIDNNAVAGIERSIVATQADKVWPITKGAGIVVGGQDTGVDWTHPALKQKYRGWNGTSADHRYSWHDAIHGSGSNKCGYDKTEPCDDDQHGTHTMGTMVGDDGASNQVGMAPDAKWIACRNMDEGVGKPSTYIECFEWFLAPYPQGGNPRTDGDPRMAPDVINNSWGCDGSEGCSGDEIVPAIHALKQAGVVIVASAGNSGSSCGTIDSQPATDTADTLTVGAYDYRNDSIAYFSSRGPSTLDGQLGPQVAAPGVGIRSSVPGGGYEGGWDGTSMAGPHVAGEVALLLAAKPSLRGNPDAVREMIRTTATPKTTSQSCGGVAGSAIPNNTWGYGIINALKAVQAAQ